MLKINDIAKKLNIDVENYGLYKGKIDFKKYINNKKSNLILVTSINPTPYGEGKTTLAIGLNDALRKLNKNSIACLREPSMGPVFGFKGGATGGGKASIIPDEDINLHFTGDMHAITSCNNLLCALIDNHIYQGNELSINPDTICFHRTMDMNDRSLRRIKLDSRYEKFTITAASEIMAILCLSEDEDDLKNKLGNILIGYTYDNKAIFARDLKCTNSLYLLLKEAIKPNLVQSLEENPVIVHGGPFANIAHGCSSLIGTKLGLSLSDYVITEAGFGADLGAEKFFDIKCRHNLKPSLIIINVTIKALKYNGNNNLEKGFLNLKEHIENMKLFNKNILVSLNKYEDDKIEDIEKLRELLNNINIKLFISDVYNLGSDGCIDLASAVINMCNNKNELNYLYDLDESLINKINKVCREIYRFDEVIINEEIKEKIKFIDDNFPGLPICISKTPYIRKNNTCEIKNIEVKNGAGFIVVMLDNVIDMPGLPKEPNALKI